jgi:hypothetical protein
MSFGQILTEQQFNLLYEIEHRGLYSGQNGAMPYTAVMPREDTQLARQLWDQAAIAVEAQSDEDPQDWNVKHEVRHERECARRVAAAIAVVNFGKEFLLK